MASRANQPPRTRVLIVDDHVSFAEALGTAIELQEDLEFVGFATTLRDANRMVESRTPDVVLMDVRLPDGNGVEGTSTIKSIRPETRVIVVTAQAELETLAKAAASGASGFLPKESPVSEILRAIRIAGDGGMTIDHATLAVVLERIESQRRKSDRHDPMTELTLREREVLSLLGEGLDPASIAKKLTISVHTARSHVKSLMAKLGVHSQLEAVVAGVRRGMIDVPVA